MAETNLFDEFDQLTKEQWKSIATKDLRGADFEEKLVWKTYEGFDVQPYYGKEDIKDINKTTPSGRAGWVAYQEIKVTDASQANGDALKAITYDIKGLLFEVEGSVNIKALLKSINPSEISIAFTGTGAVDAVKAFFDFIKEEGIDPKKITGYCDLDVFSQWSTVDGDLNFSILSELIRITDSAPVFRVLNIHSGDFINAGSNFTQELAFTLNKVVEYIDQLTELGNTPKEIVENLQVELAVTTDFFFEIAKQGVLRNLLAMILEAYDMKGVIVPVSTSSSIWSKSRHDHNVNLIRNTTEAMSAILGGADAILIKAHNSLYEDPTAFSQRVAANLSNLLREESYFDKVENPVTGTYYMEAIAEELSQRSFALFLQVEKQGGLMQSLSSGDIQQQIKQIRNKKEQDLLENTFIMVGTNKFTIEGEHLVGQANIYKEHAADGRELLAPRALADIQDTKEEITK